MENTTITSTSGFARGLKKLGTLFWVLCLMSVSTAFAQTGTISIGSGTSTNGVMPINSCYNYSYSQQIVKASTFAASGGIAGNITKIRYYYSSGGTTLTNWNAWTVYIGHTAKTEFTSNSDWEPVANLTQVYSGAITPVAGNWFEITLTTPFNYNGTSNLIIAVDENVSGYSCTANFGSYTSTANTGIYYYSDGTNPDPASPPSGTRTASIPRLQLEGQLASCLAPSGLTASASSPNTASVNWGAAASSTNGYDYYYSTANTAPNAGTTPSGSVGAGVTTASLSGLTSNTPYYVWVRSLCGSGSVSAWSSSVAFTTPCDATDVPYYQDVESAATPAMPSCVTTQNAGTGNNWTTTANPGYGFDGNVFRYQYNSSSAANAWFFSQGINLTAGTSYRLAYRYGNNSTFYVEKLKVAYGTANNAAAMTNIVADYPSVTGATSTATFIDFIPTTSGVYYIGFNAYSAADQFSLYVDDISVTETPSCEPLTSLSAETVSFTSGMASWSETISPPANGYQYYISTDNTNPTDATVASGSVAAGVLTADLTSLTEDTTYYVWVRAVCSDTDASTWFGPASFYTGYCTPAPTSMDGDGIVGVEIGTINNLTSGETGYYGDYSSMVATYPAGATVDFAITYNTGYTYGTKIWVDWNDDADFDDEGEQVYYGLSTNDEPTTLEGSFSIPADAAVVGTHRVRIGGTDNDSGPSGPCYTGAYGTFEDYTLDVFMPDAPAITGFTPPSYCAVDGEITITGTSLAYATGLQIGGQDIDIVTNTDTEITATVTAGVSGVVSVTTVAGTATTTNSFTVTAPTEIILSGAETTICAGETTDAVTVTAGASAYDTWEWTPSTGVSGNVADGYTFNPTETTTYVLTASQSAGPCVINTEYTVTVNPVPNPVTIEPDATTACLGSPVELTAMGGESAVTLTYCIPAITNPADTGDYLNNFSFAGITNNNSGDALSDYTYYSSMTANVTAGTDYTMTLQTGNPTWGEQFRVWIDFNQDGTFSANESVYNSTTTVNSSTVVTTTVNVPVTAFNGVTRMRVGVKYNSALAAGDACGFDGFGEFEDYNVNITGASSGVDFVWTPAEGLYMDAAGTMPYEAGAASEVVYAMPMATATYIATASTEFGCTASGSTTITVIVTPAPTGDTDVAFDTAATVSDLSATGENIQWYNVETGGEALGADTELHTGMYYATQTLNGCESQERLAVMVTIPEMDWVNLQWPPELTIVQGTTGTVYAQGYKEGVTPGAGPGIGVMAWIGISDEDTDPSTWTTWVPMMFNTQVYNNDEFMAQIGEGLEPGTYFYASRFQYLAGPYTYGGYSANGGGAWDGQANVSGVLTVNCGTEAPVADASQSFCYTATVAELMAEGAEVQWYATPTGGDAMDMDAALENGGTYYASQTVGCESLTRTAVTVTINSTAAPTGNAEQTFEDGATVADLMATGTDIMWYDSETATGMMLDPSTPLVDGATYYASQTMNGCESQEWLAVTVTVNAPALDWVNLQYPGEVTITAGETAMVYAQAYEAGVTPGTGPGAGVMAWIGVSEEDTDPSTWTMWIPATFNIQVGNNDEFVASIGSGLSAGTYYYASRFQLQDGPYTYGGYNANGGGAWDGAENMSGVLNVLCATPAPVADDMQWFCNSAMVSDLMADGTDVMWYADAEGGEALSADMMLEDGATYYASQMADGCESVERTAVMVTINVVATPTGDAEQVVYYYSDAEPTVGDIVVEGDGTVMWYASEEDAMNMENPLSMDTVVEVGTTYYAVLTNGDCSSASALAVTVTDVALGTAHFDMTAFTYYPNPVKGMLTMSYSLDITSVEIINLLGQKVLMAKPNAMEAHIDMSGLADGTYIVNVNAGNAVKTVKVIKKQ